ncbi:MAG: hypothetical protein EOO20_26995 [Chryseobacterium sp.]|nr:MAG: hypothetical protein EOO20_26995 [Chryseobacterium sp.]
MKTRFLTVLLLVSVLAVSCKIDKKDDTGTPNGDSKENGSQGLKVTFNAVVDKDDNFQLFFNEDGTENFTGDQMIDLPIKGSTESQELVFVLPEDVAATNFRFDIGSNGTLKEVKFGDFKMEYNGKTFKADGKDFFKYFYPNDQVVLDTIAEVAKITPKADRPYDPIIGGTLHLQTELGNFYK